MTGSKDDRKRLLVIDDDESVRRLLTRGLARAGFEVSCADDGLQAIECLRETPYDVIILDLAMPRVDGFAVLHHLRESEPYLLRRVIVLTGHSPEAVNGDPIFAVVTKPFSIDRLLAAALSCCAKTAAQAPPMLHPVAEKRESRPLARMVQRLIGRVEDALNGS